MKTINLFQVAEALESLEPATALTVLRALHNTGALSADECQSIGADLDVDFVNNRSYATGQRLAIA